jgi:hypothetical protein
VVIERPLYFLKLKQSILWSAKEISKSHRGDLFQHICSIHGNNPIIIEALLKAIPAWNLGSRDW